MLTEFCFQHDVKNIIPVELWYGLEKISRPDLPDWPVVVLGPAEKIRKTVKTMALSEGKEMSMSLLPIGMPTPLTFTYPDAFLDHNAAAISHFRNFIKTSHVPPAPGTKEWVGTLHAQVFEEYQTGRGDLLIVNARHPNLSVRDTLYALNLPGQPSRPPHHWQCLAPQGHTLTLERFLSGAFIAITTDTTRLFASKKSIDTSRVWQKVAHRAFMSPPAVDELFADIKETGGRSTVPAGRGVIGSLKKTDYSDLPLRKPKVNRNPFLDDSSQDQDPEPLPNSRHTAHASSPKSALDSIHVACGSTSAPNSPQVSRKPVLRTEGSDEMAENQQNSPKAGTRDPTTDITSVACDGLSSINRPVLYAVYKATTMQAFPNVPQAAIGHEYDIEQAAQKQEADQAKKAKKKKRDRERLKRQKTTQLKAREAALVEGRETAMALQEFHVQSNSYCHDDEATGAENAWNGGASSQKELAASSRERSPDCSRSKASKLNVGSDTKPSVSHKEKSQTQERLSAFRKSISIEHVKHGTGAEGPPVSEAHGGSPTAGENGTEACIFEQEATSQELAHADAQVSNELIKPVSMISHAGSGRAMEKINNSVGGPKDLKVCLEGTENHHGHQTSPFKKEETPKQPDRSTPFKLPPVIPALPDLELLKARTQRTKRLFSLEGVDRVDEVSNEQAIEGAVAASASLQAPESKDSKLRSGPEQWLAAQLERETKTVLRTRTHSMYTLGERLVLDREVQGPVKKFEPELYPVSTQDSGCLFGLGGRQRCQSLPHDHHFRIWHGPAGSYWYLAEPLRSMMNPNHEHNAELFSTARNFGAVTNSIYPLVQQIPPRYQDSMPGQQPVHHRDLPSRLSATASPSVADTRAGVEQITIDDLANRFPRLGQSRFARPRPLTDGASSCSIAAAGQPAGDTVTGHQDDQFVSRIQPLGMMRPPVREDRLVGFAGLWSALGWWVYLMGQV